jgi:hypothetical protein
MGVKRSDAYAFEIPSAKSQTNPKRQIHNDQNKSLLFRIWVIGIYLALDAWILVITFFH